MPLEFWSLLMLALFCLALQLCLYGKRPADFEEAARLPFSKEPPDTGRLDC